MTTALTPELSEIAADVRAYATEYGLDFFEVIFELLDYDELNMVAAYGGFPTRYPHWRFGMEYQELSKNYAYGLGKIYELVINNDPCYAYLMRCNHLVDQKMVMAHVYGHSDFFKSNLWFAKTNRKMMDETANHGTRIRRYAERFGYERVEDFLDCCLSLENLIDAHSPFIRRRRDFTDEDLEHARETLQPTRLKAKSYMDSYINPESYLEQQREQIQSELEQLGKFPVEPEKDVLLFLLENAKLERWQRDVLSIVREEAYYFAPQAMTKIMNEGWASYWHSTIMTERAASSAEIVDYADRHSGTMGTRPGVLNPYKVGLELFRDIENRWNKGRFGPEWDDCTDANEKARWDRQLGLGREKIFEVRRVHNDITFIDEFLTEEFVAEHQLFTYKFDKQNQEYQIDSRDFRAVKEKLLFSLSNAGHPRIRVEDGNHSNRGELYLVHSYEGLPLRVDHARATLENLYRIWGRPVHLETVVEKRRKAMSYDGSRHDETPIK